MSSEEVESILRQLPEDFVEHSVRDVSLLTSVIFCRVHFTTLPKYFDVNFTAIFMHAREGQMGIYRSPSECGSMARTIAGRCEGDFNYAKKIADELIKLTDWLRGFIKDNSGVGDFLENSDAFFDKYRNFFAYHQAVNFSGEYLADKWGAEAGDNIKKSIDTLDKAYTYNEMVVPELEEYFAKLGVSHLLPEEIGAMAKEDFKGRPVGRSVLYLKGEKIVLKPKEANELSDEIDKKGRAKCEGKSEVVGLGVGGGVFRGKARLITQLNKLGDIGLGEILVAPMTRPQFNKQISKAGAIVTDQGGMLSHPSILAREHGIPCVVGTKIATQVLKDGDEVEVDADKGVVRKI